MLKGSGRTLRQAPGKSGVESTGRSRLIRAIDRGYFALAKLWPAMFAYQNLLEAEIATLDGQ